jgi:hypothetical protein
MRVAHLVLIALLTAGLAGCGPGPKGDNGRDERWVNLDETCANPAR